MLSLLALLALLVQYVVAHSVELPPHGRECFHETLKKDDKMTINFQTDVGGDMKINFWITDPAHRSVNMQNHATMGEFSFDAHRDGQYTYCFLNDGHDGMNREISFNVHGIVYVSPDDPEHQDPLERHVRELVELVEQVKDEQEYLVIRERVHRNTSESTNSRVKWWSIGQTILLVAVCLFQVFYLKRFFEVKVSL